MVIGQTHEALIAFLKERLKLPLPGPDAQYKMAPEGRLPLNLHEQYIPNARKGGVLMLLYARGGKTHFVLTRRQEYPGVHSGQISFPGGRMEKQDKDLVQTALRETEEEIGIKTPDIEVLGELTQLYIPPSNFLVQPVLGYYPKKPGFLPDETEVAEILEVSIEELLEKSIKGTSKIKLMNNFHITAPSFLIQGHIVWGATAMMLSEFIHIMEETGD